MCFGRFWKNHAHKVLTGAGAAVVTVANTSWAWAGGELGTTGEKDESKYLWATAMILISSSAALVGGVGGDKAARLTENLARCPTFFARHAYKLTGGFLGLSFAFVSNYWIFNNMAMPGSVLPQEAKQFLYELAEILGYTLLGEELGNIVDHLARLEAYSPSPEELSVYNRFEDDVYIENRGQQPSRQ